VTKKNISFDPQPKPNRRHRTIYIFCRRSPIHKSGDPKGTLLKVTLPLYKHLLVGVAHQCRIFLSHTHTLVFFYPIFSLDITSVPTESDEDNEEMHI